MYEYIRKKEEVPFREGLAYFASKGDEESQVDAALFEVEWVGEYGSDKEFTELTNHLSKGILKDNDERLAFIGRRYAGVKREAAPSKERMKQCYKLIKKAVQLDENSYSNQASFAEICIAMKKKKEAVKAAETARALAELETSKIIKIADGLVARAQAL